MTLVLVFGLALLVAVLVSGLAARTVLSTSLLFLAAGALVGEGGLGLVQLHADSPIVEVLADIALFTVLFTDGAKLLQLRGAGSLTQPARALGIGMPLAFGLVAVLAHYLAGLDWLPALLVGAVLAPTDPVFASAIVARKDVPDRLRRLLSVESGLNDGLALPVVLILLAAGGAAVEHSGSIGAIAAELGGGLALGLLLPLAVLPFLRVPWLGATPRLQPLGPLSIAVLLYAISSLAGFNAYLAAFTGGVVVAAVAPAAQEAFEELGEQAAELLKFAALLVFGALLTPALFSDVSIGGYVVALLALVLVRPATLAGSLLGAGIARREVFAAAWFGPKGFASVVYGLLVLQSGVAGAQQVYELVAITIAISIVAHSSTDVPVARLFRVPQIANLPEDDRQTRSRSSSSRDHGASG